MFKYQYIGKRTMGSIAESAFLGTALQNRISEIVENSGIQRIAEQQANIAKIAEHSGIQRIADQQANITRMVENSGIQRIADQQARITQIFENSGIFQIADRFDQIFSGFNRLFDLENNLMDRFDTSTFEVLEGIHWRTDPLYEALETYDPGQATEIKSDLDPIPTRPVTNGDIGLWIQRIGLFYLTLDSIPPDNSEIGMLKFFLLLVLIDLEIQRGLKAGGLL